MFLMASFGTGMGVTSPCATPAYVGCLSTLAAASEGEVAIEEKAPEETLMYAGFELAVPIEAGASVGGIL